MKKLLIAVVILLLLLLGIPALLHADNSTIPTLPTWNVIANQLQPRVSTWQILMPNISGTQCLHTVSGVIGGTGSDCGSGGGGSGNSAFLIGSGLIYNATSTDSVNVGTSTPTTAQLFVQGSGTKNPLTIASSTGTQLLKVDTNGIVTLIGSGSQAAYANGTLQIPNDTSGQLHPGIHSTGNGTSLDTYGNGGTGNTGSTYQKNALIDFMVLGNNGSVSSPSANNFNGVGGGQVGLKVATGSIGFSNGITANPDVAIARNAAGVLEINNGTLGVATGTLVAGTIGIGTTGPLQKLHVVGNLLSDDGSTATGKVLVGASSTYPGIWFGANTVAPTLSNYAFLYDAGSTSTIFNTLTGGLIDFRTNNGSRMTVTSTGLGIGTTTPSMPLSIVANGSGNGFNIFGSNGSFKFQSGGVNGAGLLSQDNSSTNGFVIGTVGAGGSTSAGQYLRLQTASADRLVIDNNGNVGIGTTSPTAPLFVSGSNSGILQVNYPNTANTKSYLRLIPNGSPTVSNGTAGFQLFNTDFQANSTNYDYGEFSFVNNVLQLKSGNGGSGTVRPIDIYTGNNTGQLYWDTAGNVGINTTTPAAKLSIDDNAGGTLGLSVLQSDNSNPGAIISNNAGSGTILKLIGSGSNADVFLDNGNVGIGTTSPAATLDVFGNTRIDPNGVIAGSPVFNENGLEITSTGNNYGTNYFSNSNDNTVFFANLLSTTSRLSELTYSSQSDGHRLLVSNQISDGYLTFSTAGSERMRVTSGGAVGIGTTTPGQSLTVAGNIMAYGTNPNVISQQSGGKFGAIVGGTAGATFNFDNSGYFAVYGATSLTDDGSSPRDFYKVFGSTGNTMIGNNSYNTTDTGYKLNINQSGSLGYLSISTSTTSVLAVNSSGNVGIGTSSPVQKLSVVGNIYQNGAYTHLGNAIPLNSCPGTCMDFTGSDNSTNGVGMAAENIQGGSSAFSYLALNNNLDNSTATDGIAGLQFNSSTYSDTTFGTGFAVKNLLAMFTQDGPISVIAGSSTGPSYISFLTGGAATSTNERLRIFGDGGMAFATSTPDATTTAVFAGQYYSAAFDNGTTTINKLIDWGKANVQRLVISSSTTLSLTFANVHAGGRYLLELHQDATGSRLVSWPAAVHWSAGTAPTLTTAAGQVDLITCVAMLNSNLACGSNLNFSP